MATLKLTLDSRLRADGTSQLRLRLYHADGSRFIPLGLYISPAQWDDITGRVSSKHPLHQKLNIKIQGAMLAAQSALLDVGRAPLKETVAAVYAAVYPDADGPTSRRRSLIDVAKKFAATKTERSTRDSYNRLVINLNDFRPDAGLDDVTPGWLAEFDALMATHMPSPNSRAMMMRNLRAVYNYALDEGWTKNYPFRKFRIKTVQTAKRNLSADEMRTVITTEVEGWQRPYRDLFALSFFLIGANPKDLLHLRHSSLRAGRVEFNRAKTKKLYSILVPPEAMEILERYRGTDYLLDVMDSRTDYLQYVRQCNHALQLIGTEAVPGKRHQGTPLFPALTMYWARHSWASIASELDVPKETIAAALGHDMGNSTTAIYINYNLRKVDEANRKVIDYVLKKSPGD